MEHIKGESFSSCTRHEATGDISLHLCIPQNKSWHVVNHGCRVLDKSFNDLSCLQKSLPTWLSPSFALRQCCQLAVVHRMWKKMTRSFNYLSCSMISDNKYKIWREMIQQLKIKMMRAILCMLLLWQACAPPCMPRPIGLPYFTSSLC